MVRKTANSTISQASTTVERIEPIEAIHVDENPFQLDEHLDLFAVPVARQVIANRFPQRVEHHVKRILEASNEADRADLMDCLKAARLTIAIDVFEQAIAYVREARASALLPAASTNGNDRPTGQE